MKEIRIENRKYRVLCGWEDLTLAQFIAACAIPIPERLQALWIAAAALGREPSDKRQAEYDAALEAITAEDLIRDMPAYYGLVLAALSTVPADVIERIHHDVRAQLFDAFFRHIIMSSFTLSPLVYTGGVLEGLKPSGVTSFIHEGTEYQLPKTLRLYGEDVPLGEETAVTFTEAADIELAIHNLGAKGAAMLPMFMAVYCRPAGEQYDQAKAISRAELFGALRMNIVWEVFFCTSALRDKYLKGLAPFLKRVRERTQPRRGLAGWIASVGAGLYMRWRRVPPLEQSPR